MFPELFSLIKDVYFHLLGKSDDAIEVSKLPMKTIVLVGLTLSTLGCTTVRDTGSIVIPPTAETTYVAINVHAHAKCWEIISFPQCKLNLELDRTASNLGAEETSLKPQPTLEHKALNNVSLEDQLAELDRLRQEGLITKKEYLSKRKQILRSRQ